MFSSLDKAIVAFVMGALYILNSVFHISFGFTEAQVAGFIGVLTPILVYFFPNKKAA